MTRINRDREEPRNIFATRTTDTCSARFVRDGDPELRDSARAFAPAGHRNVSCALGSTRQFAHPTLSDGGHFPEAPGNRVIMQSDLELAIRKFVTENVLFRADGDDLPNDASLTRSGLVDSSGIEEIVAFLESRFPLTVEDDEMTPTNLDSIERIAAYVRRKIHVPTDSFAARLAAQDVRGRGSHR